MFGRLSVLALAVISLVAMPAHASSAGSVPSPVNLVSIQMATPQAGWGTSQRQVLRTANGGATWQIVTPPALRAMRGAIGYLPIDVVDGQRAWFAAPNNLSNRPPTAVRIFHTTDAGLSWSVLPPLHLGAFSEIARMQFLDLHHGWLVIIRGARMSHISFDIYRTTDGGRNWWRTLKEENFSGSRKNIGGGLPELDLGQSYTFQSPSKGWVSGCYCGLGPTGEFFFHTANGGHTWQPYSLLLPPAYRPGNASLSAPTFFSRQVAVLPVYLGAQPGRTQRLDIYHTHNGGRTWYGTGRFPVRSDRHYDGFVDSQHGFVVDNRGLHRTADGGRTWRTSPFRFSRQNLIAVDFVTPNVVYTLVGSAGSSSRSWLYESGDGGRTWRLM